MVWNTLVVKSTEQGETLGNYVGQAITVWNVGNGM